MSGRCVDITGCVGADSRVLVQEIVRLFRRLDDYELDLEVEGFLLRTVKAYYRQEGRFGSVR